MDDKPKKIPFCSKVITVNQVGPVCWFLATFMAMFYSQRSRKVLLEASKTWDERIEIFKILKHILLYKYLRTSDIKNDYSYFDIIKAETILTFLNKHDKNKFEFDPTKKEGYFTNSYISKLYKFLNVDTLMFDVYDKKKVGYSMFNHYTNATLNDVKIEIKDPVYINNKLRKYKTPSIIIVIVDDDKDSEEYKEYFFKVNPQYIIKDVNNAVNLSSLDDKIYYNHQEYNLDSVLLSNWNRKEYHLKNIGHAICGITCKNKRYVYNGWTRYTLDPNIVKSHGFIPEDFVSLPCELMRLDWSLKNTHDFCLNTNKCIPDNTNLSTVKELCFSFNKGKRVLIYVKKNNSSATSNEDEEDNEYIRPKNKSPQKIPTTIFEKKCPPGKVLNPFTKRCIKIKGNIEKKIKLIKQKKIKVTKIKQCPPGKILNILTNRCIKIENANKIKKQNKRVPKVPKGPKICPPGSILNIKTNRCNKIKIAKEKPVKKTKKTLIYNDNPNLPIIPQNIRPNPIKPSRILKMREIKPEPIENISPINQIPQISPISPLMPLKKLKPSQYKNEPFIPQVRTRPL